VTAVERYFFTPLYYPRSEWSILRWWESRRLLFNLSVGSAGLLSLGIVALIARLPPHPGGFPVPWVGVLVYAVLANLCYTLGPVGDLVLRRVLGDRAAAVGPGLTLLPIPVAAPGWLVSWLF
jgi:hypothetical protein